MGLTGLFTHLHNTQVIILGRGEGGGEQFGGSGQRGQRQAIREVVTHMPMKGATKKVARLYEATTKPTTWSGA